jgi:hypothetical protein
VIREWAFIERLRPDFTPRTPIPEGIPALRCLLLFPQDDPPPEGSLTAIRQYYHAALNWIETVSGCRVAAHPEVVGVPLLAPAHVISRCSARDLVYRIFWTLEAFTPEFKPLSGPEQEEVWVLMARGCPAVIPCACALQDEDRGRVGWALINDPILTAWTAAAGLERRRVNPTPGYPDLYTPEAACGVLVHEILHALGCGDHHVGGIMGRIYGDWPAVHIDYLAGETSTLGRLRKSPLVTEVNPI